MRSLAALASHRESALILLLAAAVAAFSTAVPDFATLSNLLEIGRLVTESGLICIGMTAVIVTAGIDLSVGSMLALCAVVLGKVWHDVGLNIWAAAAVAVACGAGLGAFNGLLVTALRLPPLIVTLGTMALYRGLALGLSSARPVHGYPPHFLALGQGYWQVGPALVPIQLPLFALAAALSALYLARSVWGRWLYAIGRNELAAHLAGVPVVALKAAAYTFAGLLTGLAAVIYVARVSTAKADAGVMLELDVITACVLGGVSIFGGEGSIGGAVLGLLIISAVRRGLDLAQVPGSLQSIIVGAVLIFAVAAHSFWSRRLRAAFLRGATASPPSRQTPPEEGPR